MTKSRILPIHTMSFLVPHEEFVDAVMDEEGKGRSSVIRDALDFYIPFRNEVKRLIAQAAAEEAERIQKLSAKRAGRKAYKDKIAA